MKAVNLFFNKALEWFWTNRKYTIPITGVLIAILYVYLKFNNYNNQIADLNNELIKQKGFTQIAETQYETQVQIVNDLKIKNKDLNKRLDETDRTARHWASLCIVYKAKLNAISTQPVGKDTVYIAGEPVIVDSTDRMFEETFNNEVYIAGYFQTVSPFDLYIRSLQLKFNIEVLLSESENGNWFYDVDTHSKYLSVTNMDIKLAPKKNSWYMVYGIDSKLRNVTICGVGINAGIGYGDNMVTAGYSVIQQTTPIWSVGFLRRIAF